MNIQRAVAKGNDHQGQNRRVRGTLRETKVEARSTSESQGKGFAAKQWAGAFGSLWNYSGYISYRRTDFGRCKHKRKKKKEKKKEKTVVYRGDRRPLGPRSNIHILQYIYIYHRAVVTAADVAARQPDSQTARLLLSSSNNNSPELLI